MIVHFFRHGNTDDNQKKLLSGWHDVPINEQGRQEVVEARKNFPADAEIIYVSDLCRARETAEILNEEHQLPVIIYPGLRERNFGTLTEKSWDEVNLIDPHIQVLDKKCEWDYRPWGGEHYLETRKRIMDFLDTAYSAGYKNIVAVCHGGIARSVRKMFTDLQTEEQIKNGACLTIEYKPDTK